MTKQFALYGLTAGEYAALRARAKARCEMCGTTGRLVIDHCHKALLVRGLLCRPCNSLLGQHEAGATLNSACSAYLKQHPPVVGRGVLFTPIRTMRIPDTVWHAAVARAKADGTTVTAVVVEALRRYVQRSS